MLSVEERTLVIVPARGGSKGIARKNLKMLASHPLLAYTLAAARGAGLEQIILSTEDDEIASVGKQLGFAVPFRRPGELAADDTPTLSVLLHVLRRLADKEGLAAPAPAPVPCDPGQLDGLSCDVSSAVLPDSSYGSPFGSTFDSPFDLAQIDYVCLLQPTSPLRTPATIRRCLERMETSGADSVMTVLPVPQEYNPHWVYRLGEEGVLELFTGERQPIPRRQELPAAVHREGSVYVVRRRVLEKQESLYGQHTVGVEVSRESSVNLDTPADWQRAEALIAASPELISFLCKSDHAVAADPSADRTAARR